MGLLLALLWVIEAYDQATANSLDVYGIRAGDQASLWTVFTAPFLHAGWNHLISNSVPFFVLGLLVLMAGTTKWIVTSLISIITSGLAAWTWSAPRTITVGASGLIFGWLLFLLVQGLLARNWRQFAVGLVVLFLYGGALTGVLPGLPYVSWQDHAGGAFGGGLCAWMYQGKSRRR